MLIKLYKDLKGIEEKDTSITLQYRSLYYFINNYEVLFLKDESKKALDNIKCKYQELHNEKISINTKINELKEEVSKLCNHDFIDKNNNKCVFCNMNIEDKSKNIIDDVDYDEVNKMIFDSFDYNDFYNKMINKYNSLEFHKNKILELIKND